MARGLDVFLDIQIVLFLSMILWAVLRPVFRIGAMRGAWSDELRVAKATLIVLALSPVLAALAAETLSALRPGHTLAVSELLVAAYLNGGIDMPAADFEALLKTRATLMDMMVLGRSPVLTALLLGLIAGAVWCLVRFACAACTIRRLLAQSHVWRRTGSVDIRLSDAVSIPFAVRLPFRRHIVLPSDLLGRPGDLKLALAHEFQHLRQGDTEWELAFELARPLFWWNPAFHYWKREFDQLRELACDQVTVVRRGLDPRDYATCLLDFCARNAARRRRSVLDVTLLGKGSRRRARRELCDRILALQSLRASRLATRLLSMGVLAVAISGVTLAAAGIRPAPDWSHDRLMLSTVVNLERLEAINRGY